MMNYCHIISLCDSLPAPLHYSYSSSNNPPLPTPAGFSYSIPDGHELFFGYVEGTKEPVAVLSYGTECVTPRRPSEPLYNEISFIFVINRYRSRGYGKKLMQAAIRRLRALNRDVIKVESTYRAVEFFEKLGFTKVGELRHMDTYNGSKLFLKIQNMDYTKD